MIPYVIRAGDHLSVLAYRMGFDASAVWRDAANDALRALRRDPDMLAPGDVLHVPQPTPEPPLTLSIGASNRFTLRVPTVQVRVALGRGDAAWRGERFVVRRAGAGASAPALAEGTTDGDGIAEAEVPCDVQRVILSVPGKQVAYDVRIGHLDPVDVDAGLRSRLRQLGYFVSEGSHGVSHALRAFQSDHGLAVTGALDDATRAAIVDAHGS
ncbi:MAG: peptidoglycan-binding domain-containing protein [Polyangiaceae bacterium]